MVIGGKDGQAINNFSPVKYFAAALKGGFLFTYPIMRKIFPFLMMSFIVSCSDSGKTNDPKTKFDQLEKVFGTGNWRLASYADTSYLFFSREGNTN